MENKPKNYTWIVLIVIVIVVIVLFFVLRGGTTEVQPPSEHVVLLENESEYVISPGVLVVHRNNHLMNYIGTQAPPEYEPLAEIGNPEPLMESLRYDENVYKVYPVDHIEPGQSVRVNINETYLDAKVSYMAMIVQTNDGVVWVNHSPLYNSDGQQQTNRYWAEIIDMGTEQNSPIGSGFEGGQPDPARGEENIENGTPTEEPVNHHEEFYGEGTNLSPAVVRYTLNPSTGDSL